MGREIPALIRDPRAMRDRLRNYFENTRGTLPPGALVLRTLNWARRRIPEFATGTPAYLSVVFATEVFACVRSDGQGSAVGL